MWTQQMPPVELPAVTGMSCVCPVGVTSHICLLSAWNVASETKELSFKFHFVLININFNLSSFMCLVAIVLESTDLGGRIREETDL